MGLSLRNHRRRLTFGAAGLVVAAAGLIMILPIFGRLGSMAPFDNSDWLQIYFHQAAARQALLEEGEPDYWCAYVNGGFPLASHPYDVTFSPFLPITLLAGEFLAPRINTLLIFAGGVTGMLLLARFSLRLSPWGTLAACLFYATAGWLPARFFSGNYAECFYYLFPLILFALNQAARDRRYLFAAILLLYLLMAEAKFAYPITILYLFVAALAGRWIWPAGVRRRGRSLTWRILTVAVVGSCLIGMARMQLLVGLLRINSGAVEYPVFRVLKPLGPLDTVWLLSRTAFMVRDLQLEAAHVTRTTYIGCGIMPILLGIAAASWRPRRYLAMLALALVTVFIALGNYTRLDLFYPMSSLPIFRSIILPYKYFSYFILFFVCLAAGGFFHAWFERWKKPAARLAGIAVLIAGAGWPMWMNPRLYPGTFTQEIPQWKKSPEFFEVVGGLLYDNLRRGYGIIDWYTSINMPTHALPRFIDFNDPTQALPFAPYRGEAYLLGGNGKVELRRIGFNHIDLRADLAAPDTIVINQNYLPGWRTDAGEIQTRDGLIAVALDGKGPVDVHLVYRPPGIGLGLWISGLSLVALAILCFTRAGESLALHRFGARGRARAD